MQVFFACANSVDSAPGKCGQQVADPVFLTDPVLLTDSVLLPDSVLLTDSVYCRIRY